MGLKRRLFTAAAVVCAAAAVAAIGLSGKTVSQEQEETIFSKSKDFYKIVFFRQSIQFFLQIRRYCIHIFYYMVLLK